MEIDLPESKISPTQIYIYQACSVYGTGHTVIRSARGSKSDPITSLYMSVVTDENLSSQQACTVRGHEITPHVLHREYSCD